MQLLHPESLNEAKEGMRDAAPASRKPICLSCPVIRADSEFRRAVPSEAKEGSV